MLIAVVEIPLVTVYIQADGKLSKLHSAPHLRVISAMEMADKYNLGRSSNQWSEACRKCAIEGTSFGQGLDV